MAVLALVALGALAWAWFTGRLAGWRGADAIALAAAIVGIRLLATGAPIAGLVVAGGGAIWIGRHWARLRAPFSRLPGRAASAGDAAALDDARALLGVPRQASALAIRGAYRERIAHGHPDRGGDPAEAGRLAAARDLLLADLAARERR